MSTTSTTPLPAPFLTQFNESTLLLLLQCKSSDIVNTILIDSFNYRNNTIPESILLNTKNLLQSKSNIEIELLYQNIQYLLNYILYNNNTAIDSASITILINTVLTKEFNSQLKSLLIKLITNNHSQWIEQLLSEPITAANKLIHSSYTVNSIVSTQSIGNIVVPSVTVNMTVQKPTSNNQSNALTTEQIEFQLSSAALNTMLNGLEKIREQLSGLQ